MKSSKSQQNLILTVCNRSDYLENEHVEVEAGVVLTSTGNTRKQIYLDGDFKGKRKYEDMTSCRIEDAEAPKHHEVSGKFSYFREHKKRRPPEAGNPVQFRETAITVQVGGVPVQDELQFGTSEISRRSLSVSGIEVTPDICGESDLTAENRMAGESSRSSNNDDSSMFESTAESVSKGPTMEFRSVSSLGVMHCFMENTVNGGREARGVTSSEGPGQMNSLLLKNDAHNITMKDVNDQGVTKSEPAASYQRGSGSSEAPSSVTNYTAPSKLWGRSNQEWLQLGVSSSGRVMPATSNVLSELASGEEGQPSTSLGQDHEERVIFKRRMTTSFDFSVAADCEANTEGRHSHASPGERQFRRVPSCIPPKLEVCPSDDLSVKLNPATFRSIPISSVMGNSAASDVVDIVEKPDLCIFGRRLIQRGTARPELVLAPRSCSGTTESEKERAVVSVDNSFELRRDQERFHGGTFPDRGDRFGNACPQGPEIQNRAGALSLSTPISDVHLRSAPAAGAGTSMDHDTFQCNTGNPPSSLSALQQRSDDRRHGQIGYSWLSPPATDSVAKLIPTANNFQGWTSSESATTTKLTASSPNNARVDNPHNQQAMRGLDEWGNLFNEVSPKMLFQSQCHLSEGSGSVLVHSAGHETDVGSQEKLVAFKRAIGNQKGPQWPIPPEAMNLSIASWCLNGNLQGVRGDSKLERFAGERTPSIPSDSGAVHSRFAGHHLNLSEKPPQRQTWQPAGGQTKLHHGNMNALHRPVLETAGNPRSQMLPPGSRGTSNAGLWFVLQSAENQAVDSHHCFSVCVRMLNFIKQPCEHSYVPASYILMMTRTKSLVMHNADLLTTRTYLSSAGVHQMVYLRNAEGGLPQISKAYLRIKDGKMPVSAVKKYLVTKLGLTNESEVEITCKGQPVVPSLPLQHVRDVIWFSSLNTSNNNKEQTSYGKRGESTTSASEQRSRLPAATDRAGAGGMFSKDILMVLTYRRHPRSPRNLQLSTLVT